MEYEKGLSGGYGMGVVVVGGRLGGVRGCYVMRVCYEIMRWVGVGVI